jgi:hypothetical protein
LVQQPVDGHITELVTAILISRHWAGTLKILRMSGD